MGLLLHENGMYSMCSCMCLCEMIYVRSLQSSDYGGTGSWGRKSEPETLARYMKTGRSVSKLTASCLNYLCSLVIIVVN